MTLFSQKLTTPIGELILTANDSALTGIFYRLPKSLDMLRDTETPVLKQAKAQLVEYFACKRQHFDLPLEFQGTDFQKRVWQALLQIPYGETRSYAQIAVQVGSPKAVRAVGLANSKNPISIIAACHRVIGSNKKLTGYAGGLPNKEYLLKLENASLA
ncbi:MAG: methylated-DNA--[protein]-cysteine S-methyltransferase [Myxococcota bacterium]